MAKLGDQKDINREGAYKQLGDWTAKNKDPEARADAAYNAACVLNYIDASHSAKDTDRGELAGNGDLEGITKDGDAATAPRRATGRTAPSRATQL